MVIIHNFKDICETLDKTKVLSLPSVKDNAFRINFTSSDDIKTVYNNNNEPLLPFAATEVFQAPVYKWRRLTALNDDCKDVYEITFDIQESKLIFNPGDTIGIIPHNCQSEVDTLIDLLELKDVADLYYTLSIDSGQKGVKIPLHLPTKSTLRYVFTNCLNLRIVLKKLFLFALSRYAKDENEKRIIQYFCSKEGAASYTTHILNKNICLLDFLTIFQSCKPPIEVILEHLPRLLPRPYSIVNSWHNNPNSLKICFSVMDIGNNRKGVTTSWLEGIILKNNDLENRMKKLNLKNNIEHLIPFYIRKNLNKFCLPQDVETSLILIGAGTGVSPYIGFLEEREHLMKSNSRDSLGYTWLFFGCRHPELDFIYEDELDSFVSNGVLNNLTTVFSRHEMSKIRYVQDALMENGKEVAKLILQGSYIYVCGDNKTMGTSVRTVVVECLVKYGNKTNEEAESFVSSMLKQKKYLIDIWN